MSSPADTLEAAFLHALKTDSLPPSPGTWTPAEVGIKPSELVALFESQLLSRHLDYHARRLQAKGEAFYTIGSAGHEGNAAFGLAFRHTDPAFLHYRDAAFLIQRAKALPGQTSCHDMLLSFAASADDPVSGGRHKVLGSKALNVPPQTSTIASHLPKAVGAAFSISLNKRLGLPGDWHPDSLVIASFGDASFNHSTAQGAINSTAWAAYQHIPLPLIFICEDNGLGISVPTPDGWIAANMQQRAGWHYVHCNGLDLLDCLRAAREAEHHARHHKEPVFLHMRCVRLMGHAGSDAQQSYLSQEQIDDMERMDPLLYSAALVKQHTGLSNQQLLTLYQETAERVKRVAEEVIQHPRMTTSEQVMQSIVPPARATELKVEPLNLPVNTSPQPMAKLLNQCLQRLMAMHPNMVLAGEDVGKKGGVYGVTQKLQSQFGRYRVIDTLLDEQSILGLGIGLAHNALLPVMEIQFLAYLHNAEDQLRGEAATLPFFSKGQFTNPMLVRIAGLGYQKGFGGHFHNDNAIAVLRDIPGLLLACPADGEEAVGLLQEAVRLVRDEQRLVVMLEPIAQYHNRDLLEEGDNGWCRSDPGQEYRLPLGQPGVWGNGRQLAIITYGNGVFLSRKAATQLTQQGIQLRIVNLRWLTEIQHQAVLDAVQDCEQIFMVDECRRSASISEEVLTNLMELGISSDRLHRLTATDSFIPLGKAATSTLPSVDAIVNKALSICNSQMSEPRQEAQA